MRKIAFFDTKAYDKIWFDKINKNYEITYFESKLNLQTVSLTKGFDCVCVFVNDELNKEVIDKLYEYDVKLIALRCAGFSNVDFKASYKKINVVRVPAYSPQSVAEHAMALLQTLNRKIHKAYNRTREFNFNIVGLNGMLLYGKTVGVIGTGKIGRAFIDICKGYGMNVLAYDPFPLKNQPFEYVEIEEIFKKSDIISLHCPLTSDTYHILNDEAFSLMKDDVYIVNTSRGALIDSQALLRALNSMKIKGACLDVYEEEAELFFEDYSNSIIKDDVLSLLVSKPNVILTSHQAFLTDEALENIATTTLNNINNFFEKQMITNEICYHCDENKVKEGCRQNNLNRCF